MHFKTLPFPRLVALAAAFGVLAGCPGKEEGDPTGSDTSTGTTTPPAVTEDTLSTGPTTAPDTTPDTASTSATETTTGDTTLDPSASATTLDPSAGDTTSDTSTGAPDPVCECISTVDFGGQSFTCGSGACGLIDPPCVEGDTDTDSDTDGFGDCDIAVDDAQIDCALDLLIAGESGVVKWVYSPDQGFSTSGGFVQILPERQGLTRTWSFVDLSGEDSAAGVVALRPADYFQGCKDLPTGAQRFYCMTDWSEQEPAAQCDEAGYRSDI